jgi:hypothetical protein
MLEGERLRDTLKYRFRVASRLPYDAESAMAWCRGEQDLQQSAASPSGCHQLVAPKRASAL